ncbi:tripartite tricarboxylate transporter TctB family protein [Chloroflexota bacterium]
MKLRGSSYFLIIVMAVILAVIIISLRMEHLESKLLPLIFSSIAFILAGVALRSEILARSKPETTVTGEEGAREEAGVGLRRYLLAGAWVLGFFLAIYLVGYIIAIPLFIFAYMKSHNTGWLATIIFTVLTPAIIYGIFELVLEVDLYPGLLLS